MPGHREDLRKFAHRCQRAESRPLQDLGARPQGEPVHFPPKEGGKQAGTSPWSA